MLNRSKPEPGPENEIYLGDIQTKKPRKGSNTNQQITPKDEDNTNRRR